MLHGYALVTGASQGIGRAVAMDLAGRGYGVLAVARSQAALDDVVKACGSLNGGRASALVVDLFASDAVDHILHAIANLPEPLTVLVNNAGQAFWGRFADIRLEDHRRLLRLNVEVPMELTHRCLPLLCTQPKAYILLISSMTAYSSVATLASYAGSKAFILRWGRSLRMELRSTGVQVCCACPGSVITGFTARAGMQVMDDLARKFGHPPERIAKAVVSALLAGRAEVVPGILDGITAWLMKKLPSAWSEQVASGIYLKRLPGR